MQNSDQNKACGLQTVNMVADVYASGVERGVLLMRPFGAYV